MEQESYMPGAQIEAETMDPQERCKLAFASLAWKLIAPIGNRMLRKGAELEKEPLKENKE